jgi:hypothetical protein
MHLRNIFSVLALQFALVSAFHQHAKRGSETNATLYAYGANASSWPIVYDTVNGT